MITIEVTSHNGQRPEVPLAARFDEMGGNIGRLSDNTLVLPDPKRYISRVHAAIAFNGGRYVIRDLGTASPVFVNGKPLGNGREAPIGDGDELGIAGYTMRVVAGSAPANAAGFDAAPAVNPPNTGLADPLLRFGGQSNASNPFADLIADAPSTPVNVERVASPSGSSNEKPRLAEKEAAPPVWSLEARAGIIPDDFDPFADPPPKAPAPTPEDSFRSEFGPSMRPNIDQLFDLSGSASEDPFKPGSPLAPLSDDSSNAPLLDPLVAMGAPIPKRVAPTAQRDDAPEIHGSFPLPKWNRSAEQMQPVGIDAGSLGDPFSESNVSDEAPQPASGAESSDSSDPVNVVVPLPEAPSGSALSDSAPIVPSTGDPSPSSAGFEPQPQPSVLGASTQAGPESIAAPSLEAQLQLAMPGKDSAVAPPPILDTGYQAAAPPSDASPAARNGTADNLLREFLAGTGIPSATFPGPLTPQLMNLIGQLLRECTQGTLDLLVARAMTKRQLRADVTIIATRENNPLKFSPTAEIALAHLLVPQEHGFMAPRLAVEEAYTDLRAHLFGFMAGMRAALAGVLARCQPEKLEQSLEQGMVDSLLSMNRKAKLWDVFTELHREMSREAEDEFHELFGREFLRAYEAQITELERDQEQRRVERERDKR
jgi:FHA domain-containing protein